MDNVKNVVADTDVSNRSVNQMGEQAQEKFSAQMISKEDQKPRKAGYCKMSAPFGTGSHGGKLTPFGFYEYLAGAKVRNIRADFHVLMEPITHPIFSKAKLRMFAAYVPNVRVYENAEKFTANKKSPYETSKPAWPMFNTGTLSGADVVYLSNSNAGGDGFITAPIRFYESTAFRDTPFYCYKGIPRGNTTTMMDIRGYRACYNDIFRDKLTVPPLPEWKGDTVTMEEVQDSIYYSGSSIIDFAESNACLQRAAVNTSYFTDYRAEVYSDNSPVDNTTLYTHNVTQQQIAEFRAQAGNADLTDEEVIAQIRGTYVPKENMCYLIGSKTVDLDFTLQPQTSEGELSLGAEGAYSLTLCNLDLVDKDFSAPKDGYIHYFWDIITDTNGILLDTTNIEQYKSSPDEFYRPDLAVVKDGPIFVKEISSYWASFLAEDAIMGWKRRYSEYFRHPVYIRGDFTVVDRVSNELPPRINPFGFKTVVTSSSGGANVVALTSKYDWHNVDYGRNNARYVGWRVDYATRLNYSDWTMRRLLIYNGGEMIWIVAPSPALRDFSFLLYPYYTAQTFSVFGSVTVDIDQPILGSIKDNFIALGEE